MTQPNDATLLNASENSSWSKSGHVIQGIPRGDAAPIWWSDSILDKTLTSSESWNALTGWFTVFESDTNIDHNVKVYYSNFEIWLLKGSDVNHAEWEQLVVTPTTWASYYDADIVTWQGSARPDDSSGYYEFQHPDILHGGTSKVAFDGDDVLGVFVRTKAWFDSDDSDAELLISVGVDYYPTIDSSVSKGDFANANYLPGAGTSRFVYLTTEPTWYTMANIVDDALVNIDTSSPYAQNGGKTYLTIEEWMNNHPPLED
ncbi:MAG: hypothetical protein ACK5MF_00470 [Vibrio sp.]|uniref:hypothetical protein n=1 Tax=Vibrio sp. TaxID=678 RepID=UPI003A854721